MTSPSDHSDLGELEQARLDAASGDFHGALDKVVTEQGIVNPETGEVVGPDSDDDALAALLARMDEAARDLASARRTVEGWIVERMDQRATWTVHTKEGTLNAPSPTPRRRYDAAELYDVLMAWYGEGRITRDAVSAAIAVKTTYEAKVRGLDALRKRPDLRGTIDQLATEDVPTTRRVRVSRR